MNPVPISLSIATRTYLLHEPFVISRGPIDVVRVVEVALTADDGATGLGEGHGVDYAGESPETMTAQIEAVRGAVEAGADRHTLRDLLPPGGARFALDAALLDLAAKREGKSPFGVFGVSADAVTTAYTIGIRSNEAFEAAARERAGCAVLKVKVDAADPIGAVEAVRRGAPNAALIVDPNQAWSIAMLKALAPRMAELGVVLLEQPIAVGDEAGLDGLVLPVPLCADELLNDESDLDKIVGRFDYANIKLDKVGGLTAAMRLADACQARGLGLMVGCMGGSSLSMAPGMVLAQRCRFVDLDGPLFLTADRNPGFVYRDGVVARSHDPAVWG